MQVRSGGKGKGDVYFALSWYPFFDNPVLGLSKFNPLFDKQQCIPTDETVHKFYDLQLQSLYTVTLLQSKGIALVRVNIIAVDLAL